MFEVYFRHIPLKLDLFYLQLCNLKHSFKFFTDNTIEDTVNFVMLVALFIFGKYIIQSSRPVHYLNWHPPDLSLQSVVKSGNMHSF